MRFSNETHTSCQFSNKEKLRNIKDLIKKQQKYAYFFKNNANNDEIHICLENEEIVFNVTNDLFSELSLNDFFDVFKEVFESEDVLKICFDSKHDMYYLKIFG